MTQITDEQHWAYRVPSMAFGFDINNYGDESELMYMLSIDEITDEPGCQHDETLITKPIPKGNWQIICTSKGCTEAQAESVVKMISNGKLSGRPQYLRYDRPPSEYLPAQMWTRDSRHSLETLLHSKGCDLNSNWLIIQKQ